MLKQMRDACAYRTKAFKLPIQNAVVESLLLHLRILVEILLSKGSDADDIKLTDLLPGFTSPLIEKLRVDYGTRAAVGSPCWTLNKMLAHPTHLRSNSYNYDPVLSVMLPTIWPLLDEIAQSRKLLKGQ